MTALNKIKTWFTSRDFHPRACCTCKFWTKISEGSGSRIMCSFTDRGHYSIKNCTLPRFYHCKSTLNLGNNSIKCADFSRHQNSALVSATPLIRNLCYVYCIGAPPLNPPPVSPFLRQRTLLNGSAEQWKKEEGKRHLSQQKERKRYIHTGAQFKYKVLRPNLTGKEFSRVRNQEKRKGKASAAA